MLLIPEGEGRQNGLTEVAREICTESWQVLDVPVISDTSQSRKSAQNFGNAESAADGVSGAERIGIEA
jgi:hypothetical protein